MGAGENLLSTIRSLDVISAPASGGRIQHGTVAGGSSYTGLGDGSTQDLTATTKSYIGNSGAYFDDDGNNALPVVATVATTAIGDAYAPRGGEERTLLLPTERGFAIIFEHGHDDMPTPPAPGERYVLHLSAPKTSGDYSSSTYNAGLRFLNDAVEGDDLGTTELGFLGARTIMQTAGGWQIVEDDTTDTLTIHWPDGSVAAVFDNATGKIEFAGSTGATGDAVIRKSDFAAGLSAFATVIEAWGAAHFQTGTSTPAAISVPAVSGSTDVFSG